ncbi:MAG: hypothetical protein IJP68_08680, partial [Selenomonadaceae bacterium]|nr:hypothetical protein [Selenomonadaceae bacterium]
MSGFSAIPTALGLKSGFKKLTFSVSPASPEKPERSPAETVFSVCHFNGGKSYGAGTNPKASTNSGDGQRDWTFDYSRQDYKIANIYTFVRESDAVLTLDDSSYKGFYQRHDDQATVTLAGSIKLADGASFDKIQVSSDGTNWTDLDVS